MASVTNTYARAFADVIFDQKLDPGETAEFRHRQLVADSGDLREVWEAPSIPAEQSGDCLMPSPPGRDFHALCEISWLC